MLAIAAFLSGCEVFDQVLTAGTMSTQDELEFGKKVQVEIEKDLKFVNDPIVVNYIRRVGQIVVANAPYQSEIPARFFVVNDKEINAFAIPGGNIYVHTGLINAADDEAELASVLAHEYGHVVHRHGAQNVSRAMTAGMVQQLLLGQDAGAASQVLSGVVAQGVLTNYSRQAELDADAIAVPTLYHAGYDPNGMISFFETLTERYGSGGGSRVTSLFASHPPTTERIASVKADIAALPPKSSLLRPINDLRKVQLRLRELGISG
jgi:beta-barrel assembly-enhancing protease